MTKGIAIGMETAGNIWRLREEGVPVGDIAAQLGLSKTTVVRWPLPSQSAKARVLAAVAEHGPLPDLAALTAVLPDIDRHTAIHLLYSLNKGERVTFDERGTGTIRRLSHIAAVRPRTNGHNGHNGHDTTAILAPAWSSPAPVSVEPAPRFPAIGAEIERRANIETAAAALELAGLDDLALAALAAVDGSPLVSEAIELYRLAVETGLTR